MIIAVLIIGITAAGVPIAAAIDRRQPSLATLGLGFLYGTGTVYLVLFLMSVAGVAFSLPAAVAGVLLVSAIAWPFARRKAERVSTPWTWIDLASVALVVLYAAGVLMRRPLHWDFWVIFGLKGRAFFEAQAIDWSFLQRGWMSASHPDYPLLLPLNYAFSALAMGEWDDRWMGLFTVAYGVALLLIVRAETGRDCEQRLSAAITFAAATFALTPQVGLGESPLIAFGTAGMLMIRRALLFDDGTAMRHGALLLGLAGLSKNEGMALCFAAAVAMLVARAPLRRWLPFWIPALLIGSWLVLRQLYGLETDLAGGSFMGRLVSRLGDLPLLLQAMAAALSRPILWVLMILGLIVMRPPTLAREKILIATAAVQLLIFVAVYLGTPYDAAWHVASSWGRVSRQVAVLVLLAVTLGLAQFLTIRTARAEEPSPRQ